MEGPQSAPALSSSGQKPAFLRRLFSALKKLKACPLNELSHKMAPLGPSAGSQALLERKKITPAKALFTEGGF